MAIIRSFRDLNVYQRARVEGSRVFKATKSFPTEEKYSLTDQIRRSSRAVKSMSLKPGHIVVIQQRLSASSPMLWAKPRKRNHGSTMRLIAGTFRFCNRKKMDAAWQSIGASINKMIERADDFCKTPRDLPSSIFHHQSSRTHAIFHPPSSILAHPGHRRRGFHRLAPRRTPADRWQKVVVD